MCSHILTTSRPISGCILYIMMTACAAAHWATCDINTYKLTTANENVNHVHTSTACNKFDLVAFSVGSLKVLS